MTAVTAAEERPRRRFRYGVRASSEGGRPLPLVKQALFQTICIFIALSCLLPLFWVLSLALDPADRLRPAGLIPTGATLDNFFEVLRQPTINPISFFDLAKNSFLLAVERGDHLRPARGGCGLRVRTPEVPLQDGAHARHPGCADAAARGQHGAAVHPAQPDRDRRVQPAPVAGRRRHRDRLRPAAVRHLEPQGLPRHDPEGSRGGGRGRRRDPQPVIPQGRPAACPYRPWR